MNLVDIHCHLLPYVDDGAEHFTEACALLEEQISQGVRTICVTPHWRSAMFETSQQAVEAQFVRLQEEAAGRWPELRLYLGREYFCDSEFLDKMQQEALCPLGKGNTLLLEFSTRHPMDVICQRIAQVQQAGFQVLVAHVERYDAVWDELDAVDRLRRSGAWIQVNAGSILGRDGSKVKRFCKKLIKEDLIDVVASDAHGLQFRPPELAACGAYLEKKRGRPYAQMVAEENPLSVILP